MKTLTILILLVSQQSLAAWVCDSGYKKTINPEYITVLKPGVGGTFDLYLGSSGREGAPEYEPQLIQKGLQCQFSKSLSSVATCKNGENVGEWLTMKSNLTVITFIDDEGELRTLESAEVLISSGDKKVTALFEKIFGDAVVRYRVKLDGESWCGTKL